MLAHLLQVYGPVAVLVGTFLEGETILIIAGFAAHQGYMTLGTVVGAAFVGTVAGDQLYFRIGRRFGRAFLDRRPAWKARVARLERVVERHAVLLALGFRFWFGMRAVGPFALGTTRMRWSLFSGLNVIGAAAWSIAFGGAGYLFGHGIVRVVGDLRRYEAAIFVAMIGAGALTWLVLRYNRSDHVS